MQILPGAALEAVTSQLQVKTETKSFCLFEEKQVLLEFTFFNGGHIFSADFTISLCQHVS